MKKKEKGGKPRVGKFPTKKEFDEKKLRKSQGN